MPMPLTPERQIAGPFHWKAALSLAIALVLASCSTETEPIATSQCQAAVARATYTWRVIYSPRTSGNAQRDRTEWFDSTELINRNGEKPLGAVSGPDDSGIWWPALPPRPSADRVDRRRERFERNDSPALVRSVEHFLQCDGRDLAASNRVYRRASAAFRDGQSVRATHVLGRVTSARVGSDVVEGDSSASGELGNAGDLPDRPVFEEVVPDAVATAPSIWYVDPVSGTDAGTGALDSPYRSITLALAAAQPGDTIQLGPGIYSSDSGEIFPLEIGPDTLLRGDELTQGSGIAIVGGGDYLSRTWAKQNVTVVAGDRAQISGIAFTNPNLRGTGIWIESGSPAILNNTFTHNNREGVFASGTAAPEVRNNLFVDNGGNGVSFTRESGGLFEGNTIQRSGYGIAVSETASPVIAGNSIAENLSGVVVSGEARPVLRENLILGNARDGIVVVDKAAPVVQGNTLGQNGQFDINNITGLPLNVEGSDLALLKVQGAVQ
ncbi:DUF1565 domain-containing protein [Synechococcus sp. PCC 7336]|uniref:DUF1565 domain-containing protein n=1 Tax=Synechococcus sp. PCC 7336 TaxID=195250 RepID=UPI000344B81D|nr:DUF1565 domain-containing protein [Synechococcus sp. PCC 7336]